MILVAFVLVIVATVMLIIGWFFDAGTAYIWISIGACLTTFLVLGISYATRRRGQDEEAARPEPLAGDAARSAPRSETARAAAGGGTATMVREEAPPTTEQDEDEATVTIVAGERPAPPQDTEVPTGAPDQLEEPAEPGEEPVVGDVDADADEEMAEAASDRAGEEDDSEDDADDDVAGAEDEPAVAAAAAPAPRRVAPRRVVRSAQAPSGSGEEADDGTTDGRTASTPPARRVVKRVAAPSGGTRRVVRRVATGDEGVRRAAGAGEGTRRVVRRAASGEQATRVVRRDGDGRTVRRVVRAAPASPATAEPVAATASSSNRTGTRGKRARAVLSEIKGVGPAKQDALLKRFGSLERMAEASVEDLAQIKGVGTAVATEIKRVLQER